MKREDVKAKIPGITDEQLNWIMQENGADINREKTAAAQIQTQLDTAANDQTTANELNTAKASLAKYDGVDVDALNGQIASLKFDNALDAAILGKKGRSVKAVRALLDLDTLRKSQTLADDIPKALDTAAKDNPWAFGEGSTVTVSTGTEHGNPPHSGGEDGVVARFKDLNPDIKID